MLFPSHPRIFQDLHFHVCSLTCLHTTWVYTCTHVVLLTHAGVYVGLGPDVSKGYASGETALIVSKLLKGPNNGKMNPGDASTVIGHHDCGTFYVVHQKEQLLPFAVVYFK